MNEPMPRFVIKIIVVVIVLLFLVAAGVINWLFPRGRMYIGIALAVLGVSAFVPLFLSLMRIIHVHSDADNEQLFILGGIGLVMGFLGLVTIGLATRKPAPERGEG
jgi:hypothetical protein